MNEKRVLILGATGMLGNAVSKYFLSKPEYFVYLAARNRKLLQDAFPAADRIPYDAMNIVDVEDRDYKEYDYVINCIGTIKPFMASDPIAARYINAVFPWQLADACGNTKLIHITTDCVFSGNKGKYMEIDAHDALDDYGKSKSLGEPIDRCMVIRTSIIGEEIHKNASLIEWAKSQKGKQVKGFTHHKWNGITTTTYAKVCEHIINNNLWKKGLFHVHSKDDVTKFDMMHYFSSKFNLDLDIIAVDNIGSPCDRTLRSVEKLNELVNVPTVKEQIEAL